MAKAEQILISRGVQEAITVDDLTQRLKSEHPLNIKLGVDPTSADLHLGHAVVLRKLREFQDLGHHTYLVIGDFTAGIGDPTGVNKTRPVLTDAEIQQNLQTYLDQAGKILDIDKTHVVYNSEWLKTMNLGEFIGIAMQVSLNTLIEREDFANRLKDNQSVGFHELFYPVVQGIDSVHLEADVEIGGWDQRLNMLMGRELQRKLGKKPQIVMAMKPLVGTDGERKMSKSYHNYIGLSDSADQMFGKVMSVPDKAIPVYAELAALLSEEEIAALPAHPREAKALVARRTVEIYHGPEAATAAEEKFNKTFRDKSLDETLAQPVIFDVDAVTLLQAVGQAAGVSSSEARRVIEQSGVKVDGQTVTNPHQSLKLKNMPQLQVGKHRFFRLEYK